MPLVVPGLNNPATNSADSKMDWQMKLLGKKLGDSSDETTFSRKDLPKDHRIIEEGSMTTQDHNPDRLNVHVDKDGTISHVEFK